MIKTDKYSLIKDCNEQSATISFYRINNIPSYNNNINNSILDQIISIIPSVIVIILSICLILTIIEIRKLHKKENMSYKELYYHLRSKRRRKEKIPEKTNNQNISDETLDLIKKIIEENKEE